ncbi:MAG: hypothetical protein JST81_00260 [Bacteroidetes bacterium]|jgi:hypothetical protein|nr:hypothetical protein [Bacteroidota bacterium]
MKRIACFLVLLTGINSNNFAQSNTEKTFELPPNTATRIFYIDLGKSDKIKLELGDLDDLDLITNLDSLLRVFVQDMEPLKDSLTDDLGNCRIDYIADVSGKNKIRMQKFMPAGSSFLAEKGNIAALKLEQDTLNIILKANGGTPALFRKHTSGYHFYRIGFYVNNLKNLAAYMDGSLQKHIQTLQQTVTGKWQSGNDGMMHPKSQPSISSISPRGATNGSDYLNIKLTADVQNYKNQFVPSLSFGMAVVTNRNSIKREYSLMAESHFTFARNDKNVLQTYRSAFLTFSYSQTDVLKARQGIGFDPAFSLGYLVRRRGDVFDKNTFRLGFGKVLAFGGKVKLEPVLYFNNFFKNVSPGIRISL